jgi:hypothetical protein
MSLDIYVHGADVVLDSCIDDEVSKPPVQAARVTAQHTLDKTLALNLRIQPSMGKKSFLHGHLGFGAPAASLYSYIGTPYFPTLQVTPITHIV